MLELGDASPELHRRSGVCRGGRVDLLVSVGPMAREIAAAFDGERASARDSREAAELLTGLVRAGDTVLVKGSRGIGMEIIVRSLKESAAIPAHARAAGQEQR